jgi:chromosome segregation ATPase
MDYAQAAAMLGASSPDPAVASLEEQLERLRQEHQKLKDESRQQASALKSLQKQHQPAQAYAQSLTARLCRPFYSIEKRLKSAFTRHSSPPDGQ